MSFDGKKIISDLSFEVKLGEKVVLLSKSGSGKSSLFSLVLGFIEADEGNVFFDGRMIDEKTAWGARKKIAYVDQDVSTGGGKVLDLLDLTAKLKANLHLDASREEMQKLLQYFELDEEVIKKDIENLSGGERQRLAIIIAVLLRRDVFLLDEVTSALDKHLKKRVVDFFIARKNWTCLMISHDPVWLENPAVKVFILEEGRWKQ